MQLQYTNKKLASVMYIPSLDEHGVFMTVANATREEAIELADAFTKRTNAKRKTHALGGVESLDFLTVGGLDALVDTDELVELIEKLSLSKLQNQRGLRIVYIDIENDEVAVGTTVIYNINRAMTGVVDGTVGKSIFDAVVQAQADAAADAAAA